MKPIPTHEIMHKANLSWEYTVESVRRVKALNPQRSKSSVLRPFALKDKLLLWARGKSRLKNVPIGFINAYLRDISDQNAILGLNPILCLLRHTMFG